MLMMNRLEPFYLEQASYFFELALTGSHLVMVYLFFQKALEPTDHWQRLSRPLRQQDVRWKQAQQERRIKARCKDLLEIQIDSQVHLHTVEFLHRTARDFIASPEIQAKLTTWRNPSFDFPQTLLNALIFIVQSCYADTPWLAKMEQVDYIIQISRMLKDVHLNSSTIHILTNVEEKFNLLLSSIQRTHQVWARSYIYDAQGEFLTRTASHSPEFLGLALEEDGYDYVLARLASLSINEFQSRQGRPLLDYALNSDSGDPKLPSIEVVARLLGLGADPHENWHHSSPRGRYFEKLTPAWLLKQETRVLSRHIAIAELLLSVGFMNTVRKNGRGCVSVGSLRRLIEHAFPPDVATRLNNTLTKTVACARNEKHHKRWSSIKRIMS